MMRRFPHRIRDAEQRKRRTAEAPTEAIAEILSWLPLKTLLRFKSVSKAWNKLISEPWFVNLHRKRSKRDLKVAYLTCKQKAGNISGQYRTTFTFTCADYEWNISEIFTKTLESCCLFRSVAIMSIYNDLICFVTSSTGDRFGHKYVYLCNPLSHQILALPKGINFGYFPNSIIGFGYVYSTREYKVVRLLFNCNKSNTKCEILTFCPGSDGSFNNPCSSWRAISEKFPSPVKFITEPLLVHECLHWLSWENSRQVIISFDLRTEKFSIIPLPKSGYFVALLVDDFQGKLSLVKDQSHVWVSLWELEDYDKHIWKRTYDIDLTRITYAPYFKLLNLRQYMANGELLILGPNSDPDFYYYNVKSYSFRKVAAPMQLKRESICSRGFYWESMVTL